MYTIHPSMLDGYRIFKNGTYGTELEEYLERLRNPTSSEAMDFGKAIHKFLEAGQDEYDLLAIEEEEQLIEIAELIPKGANEVHLTVDDICPGVRYDMTVDRLVGSQVHEFKTGKQFHGVDHYDSSLQWKLYCLGTGAVSATYHCITYNTVRPYTFKYHRPFTFYAFKGMETEVIQYTQDFIQFCTQHELLNLLK